MKRRSLFLLAAGLFFSYFSQAQVTSWLLTGNSGTSISTNFLGTTDNNPLAIRTNNAEHIRVTTAGTVGIGLTTPVTPLHVYANASDSQLTVSGIAPSIRVFNGATVPTVLTTPFGRIGLANQTNDFVTGSAKGDFVVQTIDTVGNLLFGVGLTSPVVNGKERMRISKVGFAGIGTQNPTARLHVECSPLSGQTTSNIRFENLPSASGNVLVIDANGYVYRSSDSAFASAAKIRQLQSELEDARTELAGMKNRLGMIETAIANNRLGSLSSTLADMPRLVGSRPNPTTGQTAIDYYLPSNVSQANCVITSLDGKTIASYVLTPQRGNGNVNVVLNSQAAGLYMYTLIVNGKVVDSQKLMLSR